MANSDDEIAWEFGMPTKLSGWLPGMSADTFASNAQYLPAVFLKHRPVSSKLHLMFCSTFL